MDGSDLYGTAIQRDLHYAKLIRQTEDVCELWGDRGSIVLAIRGTTTKGLQARAEWRSNLTFDVVDVPTIGPVHRGFFEAAKEIGASAVLAGADKPLVIAGHSRGGAIGLVLAALLTASGRPPKEVVTFGSPRAGHNLAEVLRFVAVRQYRHVGDPVPDWPDPPYSHVTPLHELGVQLRLFGNHDLSSYVEALEDDGCRSVCDTGKAGSIAERTVCTITG